MKEDDDERSSGEIYEILNCEQIAITCERVDLAVEERYANLLMRMTMHLSD